MDRRTKVAAGVGTENNKHTINAVRETFAAKWGFVVWLHQVAELRCGNDWDKAKRLPIVEFMNSVSFMYDMNEENKRQMQEWRNLHGRNR